jgi:hypothetical protein
MCRSFAVLALVAGTCLPLAEAQKTDDDLAAVAGALRPVILGALPNPLYEQSDHWGHKANAANQIVWHGLRPEIIKKPKNDGHWRKLRLTAANPAASLEFRLSDLKFEGEDRQTFKAFLALGAHVDFEQEVWEKGLRLYRGNSEARLRIKANLDVETTMRLEKNEKSFLPDTVFRLRVTRADVSYDNLVVEHIGAIGGTGARWVGEALRSSLKQWKPSIERELMAKANAAVVKAADTKEVRISLSGLLSKSATPKK